MIYRAVRRRRRSLCPAMFRAQHRHSPPCKALSATK
jgi:hypothetical protein